MASGIDAQKNALKALENDFTATYPPLLQHLQQRIDAALTSAENTIKELETSATHATDAYVAAVAELMTSVEHARGSASGEVETTISALVEAQQLIEEETKTQETTMTDLQSELEKLEAAYNKIESDAQTSYNAALDHTAPLLSFVSQSTNDVHEHGEQLSQSMQQVQSGFADELKKMEQTLRDAASTIENEHKAKDAEHGQHAQSAMQTTASHIEQNLHTLAEGMGTVGAAFGVLLEFGGGFAGVFEGGAKGVTEILEEIGHIVDAIKPVLDAIKAIE